ncbi:MAG TPA: hypothetical protein VGO11_11260 [Chthoniobacteraceae bacterium]|jgi:hypothetical protein|nr:hypothetical protein [Chthoniobacteraceae bacterium]
MPTALIICGVIGLYFLVATILLRLSTRLVAGIVPTFGSAFGAILAGILVAVILAIVASAIGFGQGGFRISTLVLSLSIQARVYAAVLKDSQGGGITYWQALVAILCQIPIAIGIGFLLGFVLAAGGLTVASLMPDAAQRFAPAGLAPRQAQATPALRQTNSGPRWGTLETSVMVPTKYGQVTYRAGTAVQIVREFGTGYVVSINGTEFTTTKAQVAIRR